MKAYIKLKQVWKLSPHIQVGIIFLLLVLQILVSHYELQQTGLMFGAPVKPILVLAPIYEEIIFRGLIFTALMKAVSWKKAIIYSSILFGLWHFKNIINYDIEQVMTQIIYTGLILGPILGYITYKTKTVWPAVIIHYLNNIWSPISFMIFMGSI